MNKGMTYKTLLGLGEDELVEKKSRFIAAARPVTNEQEALDFIAERKSLHYDATHNVYAYLLSENNIARYSDDGEPGGTAGVPALDVMKKEGLTDCAVVVTRYFGGTLLGAGGLVRAYGKSARLGILAAKITQKIYCHEVKITAGYDLLGKIRYAIETGGYILGDIEYGENVVVTAHITYDLLERFRKQITELTNGQADIQITGERYIDCEPSE